MSEASEALAISNSDFRNFGCWNCGSSLGHSRASGNYTILWQCSNCQNVNVIVDDGHDESGILFSSTPLRVSAHPRVGQYINPEEQARERAERIMQQAFNDLQKWIHLGLGDYVHVDTVSTHTSKSTELPIVAGATNASVDVTWFGNNWYSYFLGVHMPTRALPATLLYPISNLFGKYPLSGHVNTTLAPPVTDFYYQSITGRTLRDFGFTCGYGLVASQALRFLKELSRVDTEGIMLLCGDQIGPPLNIHDFDQHQLAKVQDLLGLDIVSGAGKPPHLQNMPTNVFDRIVVQPYRGILGYKATVTCRMSHEYYLPPLNLPRASMFVSPDSTALGSFRSGYRRSASSVVAQVPVELLDYQLEQNPSWIDDYGLPVSPVYNYVNRSRDTDFTFGVPSALDAFMTAFYLSRVVGPILKELRDTQQDEQ